MTNQREHEAVSFPPANSTVNAPTMPRTCYCLRTFGCLLLLAPLLSPRQAAAADPQPYAVTLSPTDNAALNTALHDSSNLIALGAKAPVGPFALVARARDDESRLKTALGSFGYYDGAVTVTIAGRKLDDPALVTALDAAKTSVPVAITVKPGPVYHLRNLTLTGPTDPATLAATRAAMGLHANDPVSAADILAASGSMLASLQDSGHALAKVGEPVATLTPAAHALDVAWTVDAGPQVDLGPIAVTGLKQVNESFVRRILTIHQGEPYDPRKIEAARQDLASEGVFATVRARAAEKLDAAGQIPITLDVDEAKRHVIGFNAGYSTDLGASAGVTFTHRNLFGNAEKLQLGAAITNLGGSDSRGEGYNVTAALTKPDLFQRGQSVTVSLQAIRENLDAYDRTAALAGIQLTRRLTDQISVTGGILGQQSRILQEGVTRNYTLLALPLGLTYDDTGPAGLLDPTRGYKANLTVTPTASLSTGTDFTIIQLTGSTYLDPGILLGEAPGRSLVALRAILGSIQGASTFQVPPDERLYAGGSATVRGYKYQYLGPHFADNRPTGGTSLGAATIEYRQRIGGSYGFAAFIDGGTVTTNSAPFSGPVRLGAGVGARYYTAIGPIRLDVAVPLNREPGNDSFEFYIGIGQAF